MRGSRVIAVGAVTLACMACVSAMAPARASAIGLGPLCSAAGLFSGLAGKACGAVQHSGRILGAGKKLLSGHLGGAAKTLLGEGGSKVGTALGLAAVGAWVLGGAKVAMDEAASLIDHTTAPRLKSAWFSASYWRMAGIAGVLTLPFLFAAAIQALMRSDLALLARAALGYLPLAVLAVSITAPLTMLLLAASDQMCALMSSAAGGDGVHALVSAGAKIGVVSAIDGSPFLAFLVGLFVAAGAFVLWLELLMRQAAVYIVVLMLPLAFAAMVWPSRRVWAVRAVELLLALILSKFAIVSVLSLAAAALGHGGFTGTSAMLSGLVLVMLAAFAPWAVVRLLPLAELASGAAGSLRGETAHAGQRWRNAVGRSTMMLSAGPSDNWPDPDPDGSQPADGDRAGEAARAETGRLAELPSLPAGPPATAGWEAEDAFSRQATSRGDDSKRSEQEPGTPEVWQQDRGPITLGFDNGSWPSSAPSGEDPAGLAPDPPPTTPDPPVGSPDAPGLGSARDPSGPVDPSAATSPEPPPSRGALPATGNGSEPGEGPSGPPVSPGPDADWPAEDHNALPPAQTPEDGPL